MSAYIIAEVEVTDPDAYPAYTAQTPGLIERFGGRFIVRGGASESLEGAPPAGRLVVIEFPDMAAAKRFYHSPEYQAIVGIRHRAATSRLFLAEGLAPA